MQSFKVSELPKDWKLKAFSKCCEKISDNYKPIENGNTPYIGLEHIASGFSQLIGIGSESDIKSSKAKFRKNDILFGKLRPYLRKAIITDFEGICSTDILVFRANNDVLPGFLLYIVHSDIFVKYAIATTTGVNHPRTSWNAIKNLEVPIPPLEEQQKIVGVLSLVQEAIRQQEQLISTTTELKKATMQKLFTEGTRGEPQKMTEIGLIPESWDVVKLGKFCKVKSSSLSFKKVSILGTTNKSFPRVLAIKVSDMNTESNQREINTANLEFYPDPSKFNFNKCISPGAIIFPKRGAAIATNKKRLLGEKAILDPNLIAVIPGQEFLPQFLYNYFLRIDLTKFTDPGCLPQLNKKDIEPADLPMPSIQEQEAITQIANLFDSKEGQHKIRLRTLQDLFQTLLHQLMTAQIRVDDLDLSALNLELQGGKQDALV